MRKEIKIGDKFIYVNVKIDSIMEKIEVKKERLNVIGVSDCMICLDSDTFTTLAANKMFEFGHNKPEEVRIGESKSKLDISIFGKFNISIYSQMSDKKIEAKLNREFKKWLDKKLGVYGSARTIEIKLNSKGD